MNIFFTIQRKLKPNTLWGQEVKKNYTLGIKDKGLR